MGAGIFDVVIADKVNRRFSGRKDLVILEAGCGSASHFGFDGLSRRVGIDISREMLDNNNVLDEKILGDLETYPLPKEAFDIVVCWDVLEHLPHPRKAMLNMFNAVRPGGVAIFGFPHLLSIKGMVTKATPTWFHRLFYRMMKYKCTPLPTYLRTAILPGKVARFAEENGLTVEMNELQEGGVTKNFKRKFPVMKVMFACVDGAWKVVSLGSSQSLCMDNCALVLAKPLRCEQAAVAA